MTTHDPTARYSALKEGGASPQEVYSAVKADRLGRIEAIRVLRCLFGFSLGEARDIVRSVDGPLPSELPAILSYRQLVKVLKEELGYCACASDDDLSVLQDRLQMAQDRTEAVNDSEAFSRASRAVEAYLPLDTTPGFASWFVYGLEQRNLIWHGFRLTDVWITDKGRWLLEAIKRLPPPAEEMHSVEPTELPDCGNIS
jgi:hypothetical protein